MNIAFSFAKNWKAWKISKTETLDFSNPRFTTVIGRSSIKDIFFLVSKTVLLEDSLYKKNAKCRKLQNIIKYQFWKNVTSEKWNSGGLLYSAITPKSEDKYVVKVFNPPEFHFFEVTFFQNWYFSHELFFPLLIAGRL